MSCIDKRFHPIRSVPHLDRDALAATVPVGTLYKILHGVQDLLQNVSLDQFCLEHCRQSKGNVRIGQ